MRGLSTNKIHLYRHEAFCVVGGFFGMYGVLEWLLLANAQTYNLIDLVEAICSVNVGEILIRVGCFAMYFIAAMLSVIIPHKFHIKSFLLCGIVDTIAVICMAFMPKTIHHVLALYPIFFAMSMQWCCFTGAEGFVSSTIFSTNNTKQTALSLARYLCDGDKTHLLTTKFFLKSLAFFHLGAGVSYFCIKFMGQYAILVNLIFIIWATYLGHREVVFDNSNVD